MIGSVTYGDLVTSISSLGSVPASNADLAFDNLTIVFLKQVKMRRISSREIKKVCDSDVYFFYTYKLSGHSLSKPPSLSLSNEYFSIISSPHRENLRTNAPILENISSM